MNKKNVAIIALTAIIFCLPIKAQNKKEVVLKTEVSEATVFINGAQINRNQSIDLPAGKTKVRFTNLSPYIDAKSVQIKLDGEAVVTSVNHQYNYLDSLEQTQKKKNISRQLDSIAYKIAVENSNREVLKEELDFLNQNKKIGGSNTGVSLIALKETANYYQERVSTLKLKDIESLKKIKTLEDLQSAITKEQNQLGDSKINTTGEVVVELEASKASRVKLNLSYYVKNAGWYPTYDIRAIDIESPIQLIYKANIRQNTKEDWTNVKLKVSSANPTLGGVAPQLKTYYLNYYSSPPQYNDQRNNNEVSGVVTDAKDNEPLVGAAVAVAGTTVGTVTDTEGKFTLTIPQNATTLSISYIGYETQTVGISAAQMNIRLKDNPAMLSEAVVIGYGGSTVDRLYEGKVSGIRVTPAPKERKREDIALPTIQIENQTAVEFEIKIPYTIKSDNKNTMVEVDRYQVPADYEYFTVPKVNKDAFLIANIIDWEKYNLLEGEANIFFENTYIGKTILDTRYLSDTLNISLGRDKNVAVSRDKAKEFSSKKFLGSKKEDSRIWKIGVKNNKKQTINLVVLDQIPVSTLQEIEVTAENLSGGVFDTKTGEVKWRLKLSPAERKELELNYKIKYPKDKNLSIE